MAIVQNAAPRRATITEGHEADRRRQRLDRGNARWRSFGSAHPRQGSARRRELLEHQAPRVSVLSCADSRVPPELVFDQGLGDMFTTRSAGQVLDSSVLGTLVYGVDEFDTVLLVVLGHDSCGAVQAAIRAHRAGALPPGHVGYLVGQIMEVVETVPEQETEKAFLDACVRANARSVAEQVRQEPGLREAVEAGTMRVEPARYDLRRSRVEWLDDASRSGRGGEGVPAQRARSR
ncbi:carbonic anhydrase [Nocardiopsis sp. NPDC058631]|uniref:carbonic anhydrase n=1 Tax=Nocardiopsis sp. NPDC058631 TaxID=3346566 RepID=UPI003660C9AF